ncbi:LuxR family maltose regulon positive regulatory protein [Kribbella amoyensis]|uniref:LuxR family maltose regulon positive regulatory protein n=1 Tax=Kribbella amoyensis TaxID=996641 RepID=A0A561BQJ2_9ACTN|nr:LuxR family maltose regulon positive regulatory protein [Kribbella amoyensis]
MLATKLFAPARRRQLVARPRLVALVDETLDPHQRLTLVSAPAGFGKTTLLADWLAGLDQRRPEARVGWVSLDDGDNDLTRLLAHVIAALGSVGLDVAPQTSTDLAALVNDVTRAVEDPPGQQWVLVLDDYHVIAAAEVHEAVGFLLDHLPDQVHLLMTTRSDPPLPLARLRTRGQLTEVRAADLRFTPDEAEQFFTRAMGLDLTTDDVHALEQRTEGWAAGLQLAALSLRGLPQRGEVARFIDAFTGSNRFVIDYLVDEVLAQQTDSVHDFLLRTAVLDKLTGALCDALTGRTDGGRTLAALEGSNLFLVPLDDQRTWYRYHHLFADVLRVRLLAQHPDQPRQLHRRASDWYSAHCYAEDAVRHAFEAEDFERAGYLVEQAIPTVRRNRQDVLMLTWLSALPDPVRRRSPVLSAFSGWSLLMTGDLDGADARLDDAEAALEAGARDQAIRAAWADTEDLRTAPATIAVFRAALAQARRDVPGTVRHARSALDQAGPDDHFIRGAGFGLLGLAAWAAGDVREGLSTFGQAVRALHAAGNLVDELDTTVVLADMWVTAGRPSRARRLHEQALQSATSNGEPYPRATADLHVGLAELDRELGELADAEDHLETARVLRERSSITENRYRWYVVSAQVRAAVGDYASAVRLLDEGEPLYRRGFYPELRPIAATRARFHIVDGSLEAATAWADDRGLTVDDEPDYLHEYEHLTLVRLLLASGRPELSSVLTLLERLHTAAVDAARDGSVLEIRVLQALAHHGSGDLPAALAVLGRALAEAPEPDSYVRLYLDEGEPMLALLRDAAAVREPDEYGEVARTYARKLLDRVDAPSSVPTQQPLVDPLSQRELEVLRLLDSELTGPEIARRLYVSVNTLRTHTKRIFTKLDVNTRTAAVRRAREHGLL